MSCDRFSPGARRNLLGAVACALLLTTYSTTSWLAWRSKGLTFDEPLHLVDTAIQSQKSTFAFDPENPPCWKYYFSLGNSAKKMILPTPAMGWDAFFLNPDAMRNYSTTVFYDTHGNDPRALVRQARLRMLCLSTFLGAMVAWCAWRFAGPLAAVVAAAGIALDPNFLAHGLIVKNDVPLTVILTAYAVAIWMLGRKVGIGNFLAVALLMGAAVTTKFSGLLAIPILGSSLLVRVLILSPWPALGWTGRTFLHRLAIAGLVGLCALLVSWGFIWACYGLRYQSAPDETLDTNYAVEAYAASATVAEHNARLDTSPILFHQWLKQWHPDHFLRADLWLDHHHLLPHEYANGMVYGVADSLSRGAFFLGELRFTGWWYYFPAVIAFKTPLATLIALALAVIVTCFLKLPGDWWAVCALAITPVLYMLAAMHSGMDIGVRHILPVYPFLYIFLGITAGRAVDRFGKIVRPMLAILLIGLAVETFAAFPDYIPFFNVAAGGSRGGARLLGDSNLDWGQELPALARWQHGHTDYQLMLYYWGSGDPRYYGLQYARLPESFAPTDQRRPTGQKPYWAISVVALQGSNLHPREQRFYEPFRHRQPTEILGGCIYMYAPW